MSITIRKAEKTDVDGKLIMKWRNDDVTRQMSFNQNLKQWDTFKVVFYEKYFNNYIDPLFAYLEDTKIGFVGCVSNEETEPETNEKVCKIGINLCPEYRGKGYGKEIIKKTIELISKQYPKMKKIIAQIKCINAASYRFFLYCRFKYIGKKAICNTECLITEYNIKKLLILAAHPDDETMGAGATIKKLNNEGYYSKLITFTDGESSREKANVIPFNRNHVLDSVCKDLNITEYTFGNFPDNKMDSIPLLDLCKFIETNVDFEPDIILTHHRNCNNIDHALVYKATITVFRPQLGNKIKIMSYFVPSSTDYNPFSNFNGNIYYDVEDTFQTKLQCLKNNYDKEMRKYPHTRSYENIENLMKVWGSEVGLKYAEKFELVREIL